MVTGAVVAALITALAVVGVLLIQAKGQVSERDSAAADNRHAEQAATDYAIGAATINATDLAGWVGKLKAGTTPQLAAKFDATAPKLEQILTPLKWMSTATPIAAKVSTVEGGIYKVDVFVNVTSSSAQTPDGAQTTVTYNVTLDKNLDWKITDVGGTAAALPLK
ncbi:hypothetical protein HLB23_23435 [Nocardia uniformis]|uniref:Mce-associated membrane protein n=2 Tax=Nocardia uniformis TaxID=53432 RepID=A0A849CGW8_9NOCA|nr:hypothetical protein [Nocardia uniformis]